MTSNDTPALARDDMIDHALRNGAWAVFSLSGGKDSGAAALAGTRYLDSIGHPKQRRLAIHADLGEIEWRSTPATVAAIAAATNLELIVVRRAAGSLYDRWIQRFENGKRRYEALETYNLIGPWSSSGLRFCTSELKTQVIGTDISRRLRGQVVISIVGIRRDESRSRASTPIALRDERLAKSGNRAGTEIYLWHPIARWSASQVFDLHRSTGFPLHEDYDLWQADRMGCAYCVLASQRNLAASARAPGNAEIYRNLVALEARSTFSFQPTRWLGDVAPHLLSLGAAKDLQEAKIDATERRDIEARMPPGLRFQKGWPPRVPSLDEASDIAKARMTIIRRHGLSNRYPTPRAVKARFAELVELKNKRAVRA